MSDSEVTKRDYDALGGWIGFRSGEWLPRLIAKSFKNYWERADYEHFRSKYAGADADTIAGRLIGVAAKNAAALGAATGAAISADEFAGAATAGLALPAGIAIGLASISVEAVGLVHIWLKLVANLGRLYAVPLDPDDPEDILTILAFALGGGTAEVAGKAGMKVGSKSAALGMKSIFKGEVLAAIKKIAAKLGVKILQRQILKYTVPVASIGLGAGWNYWATKWIGRIAIKHFAARVPHAAGSPPED